MMYKAFSVLGMIATLFLFQGCWGAKKEVASAPAATVQPVAQSSGSTEKSDSDSQSSGQGAGSATTMAMPGGDSGGMNSGGMNSGGVNSGGEAASSLSGNQAAPISGLGMGIAKGGNRNNGGNQPIGQADTNNPAPNNSSQNNFTRPQPQPVPPPSLKEQAVFAFQSGNPKRAYTLLESHALAVPDEEAAEVLQYYRWSSHRKRLQLGLNVAVGVTVTNPQNRADLAPIGSQSQNNGGGGRGDIGTSMGSRGGSGAGGGTANSGNGKSFADTTGDFGSQLVAAFKELHGEGAWSNAFREYSLMERGNNGQFAGGAFGENSFNGGGQPSFPGGNSSPNGFAGSDSGPAGGFPKGGAMNSGGGNSGGGNSGRGMAPGNVPGGSSGGSGGAPLRSGMESNVPKGSSGGSANGGGAAMSGMESNVPKGSSGGSVNGGGANSGNSPLQFQGKGKGLAGPGNLGMAGPGMAGPGMAGPGMAGPGMEGMGMEGMGMAGRGMPSPGFGGPDEPGGAGMGGAGMFGPGMSGNAAVGNGGGNAGRSNPGPFAIAKLPSGSSPLAPCLTFIGVDEASKLMKKATQEGYDALMLYEVTIGWNQRLQRVTNDTFVRVVQPNLVAKDVKRVYVSQTVNNLQSIRSKAKGVPDGLEETIEKTVKASKDGLALQPLPAFTPEMIAGKRIPSLAKDKEASVIDRLSEVNLYYFKGFIDGNQKADAFEEIAGQPGRLIATGSSSERLAAVEKLLEKEFKQ